ncbi:MAG: ADP-ribosylation factor-like protein [Candidatus Heimdallarchaeota archaeon]
MLHNIFLFKGKKLQVLEDLNIYCYPKEIIKIDDKLLVNSIIKCHEQEDSNVDEDYNSQSKSTHYKINKPVSQYIHDLNIYTSCINDNIIIGLIFEEEDNPYDYKDIFEDLLCELLNNGNDFSFDDEIEIDNLLISIFIDLRRYGDEVVEKTPEIEFLYQREAFFKVFLFGIDEVGKSSLVRRLKTGKFTDNYFMPTRKFEIEYIQSEERGLLAIWDMPGQFRLRSKWLIGLQDSNIIVYMIDIANQRRFEESKKEIWNILQNEELNGIPLLILGNKIDLIVSPDDISSIQLQTLKEEIFTSFNFEKIKNREWAFLFTSVKTNFNIDKTVQTIFDLVTC